MPLVKCVTAPPKDWATLADSNRKLGTPMKLGTVLVFVALVTVAQSAAAQKAQCPSSKGATVYILKGVNDNPQAIIAAATLPNAIILLAPDVDIDFSNVSSPAGDENPLIVFAPCVTLASYRPQPTSVANPHLEKKISTPGTAFGIPVVPGSGRTPNSVGPVLRFCTKPGPNYCNVPNVRTDDMPFMEAKCDGSPTDANWGDGLRVLGIRVLGADYHDHHTQEIGISIIACHNAEVANSELAGWGGAAIHVDDTHNYVDGIKTQSQVPSVINVKVHDNYIHHNQYSEDSNRHSLGYGVSVTTGAFVEIYQNVFDYNKHSITANGDAGGYNALRNLILKSGGFNGTDFDKIIHVVDVHGTRNCPGDIKALYNCGTAGFQFLMTQNTFQYSQATDIKIRGKPAGRAIISSNIFARSNQGDAISLQTTDHVFVTKTNQYNIDTFGHYGVCDIDGDGIDDLVLMTGVTWWYSSGGRYPWTFLKEDTALLQNVRLGDVDGDGRCDVVKDAGGGHWMVSSGGKADWKAFGYFLAPLNQVQFGRFDAAIKNLNPGVRAPPTHAFWRGEGGKWFVTPLAHPNQWTLVGSSGFAFSDLRFGDFTGDGVTDVLGNEGGHWAISDAARGQWQNLNPTLNDPVDNPNVFIARMDAADNVDDVLRLDSLGFAVAWGRSFQGKTPWRSWKSYEFNLSEELVPGVVDAQVPLGHGYVGHFGGGEPAAGTLTVDQKRVGHFYSQAQIPGQQEWLSLFAY